MEKLSFVIPCYGSENTIESVIKEIETTVVELKYYDYEVILVNDSSPDNVLDVINEICKNNTRVKAIGLAKNFGQHSAIMSALHYVSGDFIIFLDDDGQTPVDEVGKLIKELELGFDVVYARYGNKKHSYFRNIGSKINDIMSEMLIGKPKDLYISSYFVCKRFIIEEMKNYKNPYPYLYGLILRTTNKISNVDVTHRERMDGKSGYTVKTLLSLWLNGFTAFSVKPLRIATIAGMGCAFIGFIFGGYTILCKIFNLTSVEGYSSLMSALLFIGGIIMIMLGLIGEYIGRIYISINNSPQYVIREKINCDVKNKKENKNE